VAGRPKSRKHSPAPLTGALITPRHIGSALTPPAGCRRLVQERTEARKAAKVEQAAEEANRFQSSNRNNPERWVASGGR
jgi:hypothetical protein